MSFVALALSLLALPSAPASATAAAADDELDRFEWFPGPWFSALGRARAEGRTILVAFVADGYPWCDKLTEDTFADPGAAGAVEELICLRIDLTPNAEGHLRDPRGLTLTKRFPVRIFPSIFFVSSEGLAEDLFAGYIPPAAFVQEVARIRAGTDTRSDFAARVQRAPEDIGLRLRFARKLMDLGDIAGHDAQMATVHELDPEGTSLPVRRSEFDRTVEEMESKFDDSQGLYDTTPLLEFIADEKHDELLFLGWSYLADLRAALDRNADARRAFEQAWAVVPAAQRIDFGVLLARAWFEWRDELDASEKAYSLEVATAALAAAEAEPAASAPRRAACLEARACSLYVLGKRREALETIDRAIELAPEQAALQLRRELFDLRK